ncbi:MAG: hypothetical protein PHG83_02780 [Patescibacteria group bacterium]|nr:hypothetical protein [Patescibacteria group bacterium]
MTCYHMECEGVLIEVTLGQEQYIHSDFITSGGVGRLKWDPDTRAKSFGINTCSCPKCKTSLEDVVIVSNGRGRKPTIFGYESKC